MMRFIRPRLRKPVGIVLFGTVYAAAWLAHCGNRWEWAITAEIGVIALCDRRVPARRAGQRRGCAVRFPD